MLMPAAFTGCQGGDSFKLQGWMLTQVLLQFLILGSVSEACQPEVHHLAGVAQHLHSLVVGVTLKRLAINLHKQQEVVHEAISSFWSPALPLNASHFQTDFTSFTPMKIACTNQLSPQKMYIEILCMHKKILFKIN